MTTSKPVTYKKDGYYQVSVTLSSKTFTFISRGYKIRSWIDFEASLSAKCEVTEITQAEFDALHWTSTDIVVEADPKVKVEKSPKKPKAEKPTVSVPRKNSEKANTVTLESFFE